METYSWTIMKNNTVFHSGYRQCSSCNENSNYKFDLVHY